MCFYEPASDVDLDALGISIEMECCIAYSPNFELSWRITAILDWYVIDIIHIIVLGDLRYKNPHLIYQLSPLVRVPCLASLPVGVTLATRAVLVQIFRFNKTRAWNCSRYIETGCGFWQPLRDWESLHLYFKYFPWIWKHFVLISNTKIDDNKIV